MAIITYNPGTGAKILTATGGIATSTDCCCDQPDCNSCNPALSLTYSVEIFSDVTPWDDWNGTYTLTWTSGCVWRIDDPGTLSGYIELENTFNSEWSVLVYDDGEADARFIGVAQIPGDGVGNCDPFSSDPDGKYYGDGNDYAVVE